MICNLCPRNCGAARTERDGGGACGMPWAAVVAKAMLHRWEEPCLTGENGAGAVFFTGCALGCVYCQNRNISRPDRRTKGAAESGNRGAAELRGQSIGAAELPGKPVGAAELRGQSVGAAELPGKPVDTAELRGQSIGAAELPGKPVSAAELRGIFRDLIGRGAACLDLVTPSHFTPLVREALRGEEWGVPVVWNSSGYEKVETLRTLEGLVQVYLPDLKYALPDLAREYSGAADYFQWAAPAIGEMFRQTGRYRMENGRLLSGVLIRHLMLPGALENTRQVIDWVSRTFRPGDVLFSLMRQYTPQPGAAGKLSRRVAGSEYRAALEYARNCGIVDGYAQDAASAEASYTPDFH